MSLVSDVPVLEPVLELLEPEVELAGACWGLLGPVLELAGACAGWLSGSLAGWSLSATSSCGASELLEPELKLVGACGAC